MEHECWTLKCMVLEWHLNTLTVYEWKENGGFYRFNNRHSKHPEVLVFGF